MIPVMPTARSRAISRWYCWTVHGIVVLLGCRKVALMTLAREVAADAGGVHSRTGASTAVTAAVAMTRGLMWIPPASCGLLTLTPALPWLRGPVARTGLARLHLGCVLTAPVAAWPV